MKSIRIARSFLIGAFLLGMTRKSTEADDSEWSYNQEMEEKQLADLAEKAAECKSRIYNETELYLPSDDYCPAVWDGIFCWPFVKAGTTHYIKCPGYINGFYANNDASRTCLSDGTWFIKEPPNNTWTNYTNCHSTTFQVFIPGVSKLSNSSLLQTYVPVAKVITQVGYSISLCTLVVALFILAFVKKLRCPRNSLHMHLFSSFILRASISLIKSTLIVGGVGLSNDVVFTNGYPQYLKEHDGWECKLITSLLHYFLLANYCWILMEGLYLHNLIFLALFSDNSGICLYVALGWGVPVLIVVIWIFVRASFEDTVCWSINENQGIFWILRGPITLSILVNFFFFINISRILFLKLTSSHAPDSRKYRKLAKSTLVLVPLFGVHYTAFLLVSTAQGLDETTEIIWLLCDQFLASSQGFFVAVLYCFMNGEVQAELRKKWQNWYQARGGTYTANGRSSILTQSLTYFSRTRNSTTTGGESKTKRRNSGKRPQVQTGNAECSSYTSYYNNHSNTASPYLGRVGESSCNFSYYPATSENNLTSFCDKSPTTEGPKTPTRLTSPTRLEPPPNALTPMLMNGGMRSEEDNKHDRSPAAEKVGLLLFEKGDTSTGENESAV